MNEFEDVVEKIVSQLSNANVSEAKNNVEALKEITIDQSMAKLRMIAWDQQ